MRNFDVYNLKNLYIPPPNSHKGQNGKLMVIGGSKLFHAASLWSLKIASRIVDMVYYSSVDENNQIVQKAKEEFRDGIVVRRDHVEDYIQEADCVLIGPGLPRMDGQEEGDDDTKELTEGLIKKYPQKKWVIDGGSLQTINQSVIPYNAILTPHLKEFEKLFNFKFQISNFKSNSNDQIFKSQKKVGEMAKKYNCIILLKGKIDIVCSPTECVNIKGGNAGMTKGGTGDVLAGLVAAFYCKNDAFLSATAGSYINKKAGDELYKRVGYYFNASDLADEIPRVMKELIITK
ncbi:MAG: NAD(P)H-hydrate dehydratase [Patescibacteria group bacterium]